MRNGGEATLQDTLAGATSGRACAGARPILLCDAHVVVLVVPPAQLICCMRVCVGCAGVGTDVYAEAANLRAS